MALSLPIYFLGATYVLHTRVAGHQVKRSLRTANPRIAKLRAIKLLGVLHMGMKPDKIWDGRTLADFPHLSIDDVDETTLRRYEVDIRTGRVSANSKEEHEQAMEAIDRLTKALEAKHALAGLREWESEFDGIGEDAPTAKQLAERKAADAVAPEQQTAPALIVNMPTPRQLQAIAATKERGPNAKKPDTEPPIWFSELMDKFEDLNGSDDRTNKSYRREVENFEQLTNKPHIWEVNEEHISAWQAALKRTGNTSRTVDKKVDVLKSLFNFGKKQNYFGGVNPAADRNLVKKKDKKHGGWRIWALDEVKEVMGCPEFGELASTMPDLHLFVSAAVISGIRATALATLEPHNMRKTVTGTPYIKVTKDKTPAGRRDVPIPLALWERMAGHFEQHRGFGYKVRDDGGGASDPVRKDLATHLARIKATGRGFTVHGLRKTLNTKLREDGVPLEDRCQLLGHEIENVNVQVYTPGQAPARSIDQLGQIVLPTQQELMGLIAWTS